MKGPIWFSIALIIGAIFAWFGPFEDGENVFVAKRNREDRLYLYGICAFIAAVIWVAASLINP